MHERETLTVAYILESISPGWLTYEIDALTDRGVRVEVYPTNPARYPQFRTLGFSEHASTARDAADLAALAVGRPMETSRRLSALRRRVGWRIAGSTLTLGRRIERTGPSRPELIHTHFASGPALSAMTASDDTRIPFGFTAHAYDIFDKKTDWALMRRKCEAASFVRCISEHNKRLLLDRTGVDEDTFSVIHCGIDVNRFKETQGKKKKDKIILTVCNLVEKKGIPDLLSAYSDPFFKKTGHRLIIAGDGPLRNTLENMAKHLGIDVDFIGAVSNVEVDSLYHRADIFVLPSIHAEDGDMDGIPVVLMEAMASGIPVVSTAISGIPELIESGTEGLLVPEKTPKRIAEAMRLLLEDDTLYRTCSHEGRQKVFRDFNIETISGRLHSLYAHHAKTGKLK